MKRPGRLRFEYQIPSEVLVLVSAGQMAIFDPKGDGEPTSFTTSGTPLSLILQDRIDLQKSALITDHRYAGSEHRCPCNLRNIPSAVKSRLCCGITH